MTNETALPTNVGSNAGLGLYSLKPCAHCGHTTAPKITSAAELNCEDEEDFNSWPHSDSFAVICDAARPGGAGGCGAMGGFMPTEAEAVQRWNTRASDDDEAAYTAQQVADACMAAEIPDSKCESVLIALRA
jgi:hypothetical protein